MYYKRRYYVGSLDKEFIRQTADILEAFRVEYVLDELPFGSSLKFSISENHDQWVELEPLLPKEPTNEEREWILQHPFQSREDEKYTVIIIYEANYTEEERLSADWLEIYSTYEGVDPKNGEAVIAKICTYPLNWKNPLLPKMGARHYMQAGSYAVSKSPKWGTNRFFSGCSDGIATDLFCRDLAKEILEESGLAGIRFAPVLKYKTIDPMPDVHQLVFDHIIPAEAIVPIQGYVARECETCHKQLLEPNGPFIYGIKAEMLDRSIDFFATDPIFGAWPYKIVSQRVYRLLREKKMDKNLGFIPRPSK